VHAPATAWVDERHRSLYPLSFPTLQVDPDVFEPTEGSFLIWKHLFQTGAGAGRRCLDVGCGCGILAIQLAINGAEPVETIDISRDAVANTMANAYRNEVEKQITARADDLYTFTADATYDLIVASLYQMPVDPYAQTGGHRPQDYWGRNLVDHLITLLPRLLSPDGIAYVMQLSILGQLRTAEPVEESGLHARVVDFDTFSFSSVFTENLDQIKRVEQLSDAYHLKLGRQDVMVAYLLEIRRGTSNG
jgi:release factor glutamine methyltransferase